jgi:5-(carboxyamino)imidazole ribonucleotide synthase
VTLVACIGGGQLGRMLGLAGIPLGVELRFLDPSPEAPARAVGELVVGDFDDEGALRRLTDGADVVTYEFENVSAAAARAVGAVPGARALELTQDRLEEKELFRRLGIPTAEFSSPRLPALAKTRRLGYDGKGQRRIESLDELREDEIAEELVDFRRELSLIAVRSPHGESAFYPLVENTHRDGILRVSRAPAAAAPDAEARDYAARLLDELDYAGVLALELFETEDGRLLANEVAPRVHNSGHWTIEGAETSQFENHLRAILALPLGSTAVPRPAALVNLIGAVPPLEELLAIPGAHVHLYGKAPRPGRKLGHVTLVGEAVARLDELPA